MTHIRSRLGCCLMSSLPIMVAGLLLASISGQAQTVSQLLVTGKSIIPWATGVQQNVGSLPMNIILSADGKYALVSDMGFDQSLTVINKDRRFCLQH